MKKTFVAALVAAATIGAASTTFAAANPFSDVPRDHWAYDAVTQLAADGVVEGYGDGTYRGERNITRYEMAQMVARAMAKDNISTTDRALVDRLAAEFADELNNLGVRVSNLERNADMVKWTGYLRYIYSNERHDDRAKKTSDKIRFRVYPTAEINKNWTVTARITSESSMKKDAAEKAGSDTFKVDQAHAIGKYGKLELNLGQMQAYSDVDDGMLLKTNVSGVVARFGNVLRVKAVAGRMTEFSNLRSAVNYDVAANYQGLELLYTTGKLTAGAGYHHLNSGYFKDIAGYSKSGPTDNANIWTVGGSYAFDKNISINGAYAENSEADIYDKAGNIALAYKGAKKSKPGSWGLFLGYRHLGANVALKPAYKGVGRGQKGVEIGFTYAPLKNVSSKVVYFRGKDISTDKDASKAYASLTWNF